MRVPVDRRPLVAGDADPGPRARRRPQRGGGTERVGVRGARQGERGDGESGERDETSRGEQGDYAGARIAFERALEFSRELGAEAREAAAIGNLATLAHYEARYSDALVFYERALELYRKHGATSNELITIENIGNSAILTGDVDAAIARFRAATELAREAGATWELTNALRWLARALILRGEVAEPARLLDEAVDATARIGYGRALAETLEIVAELKGDEAAAARLLGAADGIRERVGVAQFPDNAVFVERRSAELQAALGARYDKEHKSGRGLSVDEAVALAHAAIASRDVGE